MTLQRFYVMARAFVSNVLLLLLSVMLLGACSPGTEQQPTEIRNVILFVGDGFGATQMSLGIQYARGMHA